MDRQHRGWLKELLEWLHHAYWIREFVLSTGIWGWIVTWAVRRAFIPAAYRWPVMLSLIGLSMYLLVLFRPRWTKEKAKPSDLQSAITASALVVTAADASIPADVDIRAFFRNGYRTPLEAEVRKNFYLIARQESPTDVEKFYLEFIGVGFLAAMYDTVWWPMYRSQLASLSEINRNGGRLPISKVKTFFDAAEAEFRHEYQKFAITFDGWLGYLTRNHLLIHHPSDMLEITLRGKDFLKFLTHWGRGLTDKRL